MAPHAIMQRLPDDLVFGALPGSVLGAALAAAGGRCVQAGQRWDGAAWTSAGPARTDGCWSFQAQAYARRSAPTSLSASAWPPTPTPQYPRSPHTPRKSRRYVTTTQYSTASFRMGYSAGK